MKRIAGAPDVRQHGAAPGPYWRPIGSSGFLWLAIVVLLTTVAPRAALAQTEDPPPAATLASTQPEAAEGNVLGRFVRDVGGDYLHFLSWDTAVTLGVGGLGALAIHPADEYFHERAESGDTTLHGGNEWGSQYLQFPLAVGWWIAGAAVGSANGADAGRDMVRAQIAAFSWAYALKYAADRTRPNGDPRSFPSGHATTSFATATVLQEHYGWKLGVPMYALATYTAASRVAANQHWASDVVFGAALGIACGRTVTIHVRGTAMKVEPAAVPGGGAILFTTTR